MNVTQNLSNTEIKKLSSWAACSSSIIGHLVCRCHLSHCLNTVCAGLVNSCWHCLGSIPRMCGIIYVKFNTVHALTLISWTG